MANLGQAFDSNQHEDMASFEPIPADEYQMQITNSDLKVTSKKDGKYVKLEFTVMAGEFKGRKVWQNLNIINPSSQAVEIAQKELATICRACGKAQIQDTQELHGIPMFVKIGIKPPKGDYPAGNKINGYKSAGTAPKSAPTTGKTATGKKKKKKPVQDGPGWE